MTAVLPPRTTSVRIDQPGVYELDEDVYHADPYEGGSLSTSNAKLLLPPSCPAKFRYAQDHPPAPKSVFDLGHVAHKFVLGKGAEIVRVDADDWRTKAAKEARAEARAEGKVPILADDYARAEAMAAAVRADKVANALLNPDHGKPEQSLFWVDEPTGVVRRARLDWLPSRRIKGRLIIPDLKTTYSAAMPDVSKAIYNNGYCMQGPAYLEGVRACGLDDDPAFVFIFVEREPPHIVSIVQLDADAEAAGRALNRKAIDLYAKCRANDDWPAYTSGIASIGLPTWALRQLDADDDL